jgi:hypothetical protein
MADLYLTALNRWIRVIEKRLRTNKNADWTDMTDKQRQFWKEQLRCKEKMFKHFTKKYWRKEEYEHYLEKQAEMQREEQILNSYNN